MMKNKSLLLKWRGEMSRLLAKQYTQKDAATDLGIHVNRFAIQERSGDLPSRERRLAMQYLTACAFIDTKPRIYK